MNDVLSDLRRELDSVDGELLSALRHRLEICERVAKVKVNHDIPMMQPDRVSAVVHKARTYGIKNNISPEFLETLYRTIIEEACRFEDEIIEGRDAKGIFNEDSSNR